jgi:drug/metabolite transporter (DMT)-like permease
MGRDDDIQAIVALGRRTRRPPPRWLWIAAAVIGGICVAGFAVMMLAGPGPPRPPSDHAADRLIDRRPVAGPGLGVGLVIGAGAGFVIGFSLGRQRRSHSSRRSP